MKYSAELIAIAGMLICFGAVGLVVFVLQRWRTKYENNRNTDRN